MTHADEKEVSAEDQWGAFLAVDTNADSVPDTVLIDTDADNVVDTVVLDTDQDEVPDTVLDVSQDEVEQAWSAAMAPDPVPTGDVPTSASDWGVPGTAGLDTEEEFPELDEDDVPTDDDLQDAAEDLEMTRLAGQAYGLD